ncbi:ribonuclease HII [Sphingoaurantiacus capsulatus]|uniref:Ribonuclease HII n=1 Tax=Sphingoaurantiacus capsulatus TaxID=1771310 RepID=A0ABV7XDP2_9SPHN
MKIVATFDRERAHGGIVAGVDEAGRGPLAGPVVAAAVILDGACIPGGIGDSKVLTAKKREQLYGALFSCAEIGVGQASVEEIDTINILRASHLAMERAVAALPRAPEMVLVDGNMAPKWAWRCQTLVGGDALCLSIAAASIIAKVFRDRLMLELHAAHPEYAWGSNMGYGTLVHRTALARFGPTPHHRKSFAPVAQFTSA